MSNRESLWRTWKQMAVLPGPCGVKSVVRAIEPNGNEHAAGSHRPISHANVGSLVLLLQLELSSFGTSVSRLCSLDSRLTSRRAPPCISKSAAGALFVWEDFKTGSPPAGQDCFDELIGKTLGFHIGSERFAVVLDGDERNIHIVAAYC
jgi:hypothetical protein